MPDEPRILSSRGHEQPERRRERDDLLAVVVPCCNEADVLPLFHQSLTEVLETVPGLRYQIIFVDDGSTDATLDFLNTLADGDDRVRVYSLSRNFGHQVALTAGLDVARADAVVQMDCDLQHPPEVVPRMVDLWREGHDVVSAVRENTAGVSTFKRLSSLMFYWLINRLSDTPIVQGAADFCLLSRPAHQALQEMPERHRFLRGMISWIGFRRTFVPFVAPPRAAGESKYTLWRMARLAFDATFSFSARPIRIIGRMGMGIVALGFVYLAYIVLRYLFLGDLVPGWASLIATILIVGGLQLVAIGISGEYLARVFEESKGRPLYFFKQAPQDVRSQPVVHSRAA
jgi:dolichol-phosphate mannosyltransferase